jgi:glucose/arabinose dehydrogenase
MNLALWVTTALLLTPQPPQPHVSGLNNPQAVTVGVNKKIYVSVSGIPGQEGGAVVMLDNGKPVPFATGLGDPRGLAAFLKWVFVADKDRVWRIDFGGQKEILAAADAFPQPPKSLTGLTFDPETRLVYVAEAGDGKGEGAAIYRINLKGTVSVVTDATRWKGLHTPSALAMDGVSFLLVTDAGAGTLHRIRLADGSVEKLADGLGKVSGLAWDHYGRLFLSDGKAGRLLGIARPGQKPVALADRFEQPAGLGLDPSGKILVADRQAGTLTAVANQVPGAEVDVRPHALKVELAFPDLKFTGYEPESAKGLPVENRPVLLTHAGDGSNRIFVADQRGVIHVFPNDPQVKQTKVFLDIKKLVRYNDRTNEEGFLGLAFHPKYKENGEFFVFYTPSKEKQINVVARYRVSKDDPDRADPDSEEVLLTIKRPFWNHDGGTILFGPDGYLYVALGDGGAANDPFNNGQNLNTLLAKILRIDVDRQEDGKKYAIPKDNPFVGRENALPETWAYGLRNVWRMAFDRKTGKLWAADVGQNLYEEIDIIVKGGNYGWKLREGVHPFSPKGVGPRKDLIEPIWEYHHAIGLSITGGHVYRGKKLPELDGAYIYGDYVTGRIWALRYDEAKGRVVENRPIPDRNMVLPSFGEDEQGEIYYLTFTRSHRAIYRFARADAAK